MTYTLSIHGRFAGVPLIGCSASAVVFAGATDFDDGADKGVEYTYDPLHDRYFHVNPYF